MRIIKKKFGEINYKEVNSYTLLNEKGVEITCINYGAVLRK